MARPKSEDRRSALLAAATKVFAKQGLSASTSLISKTAEVSEGSFFTYFSTKDDLINALYQDLRGDLAAAVMDGFPRKASVRARLEHVWNRYVDWGVRNPLGKKALRLVSMSNVITPAVRSEGGALVAEVERLQLDAVAQRKVHHLPPAMTAHALKAFAEMTMDLIERQPKQAAELKAAGFQMLWGALSSKS